MNTLWTSPARFTLSLISVLLFSHHVAAQGYDAPLTIQGLDHHTSQSAASRAFGGVTIGLNGEASTMFLNPASLQSLDGIQIAVGGVRYSSDAHQEQQYAPLKYYSNFSLLMEGLTGRIPNPDTSLTGVNAGDTVQRPFDTIGPNWSRSQTVTDPLQAVAALPFRVGDMKFAGGIGLVQYADLNHYYQNNNVLNPSILSERPYPVPRPPTDSIPVITRWYQSSRFRDGSIRGYGGALSAALSDNIVLGVSGLLLKGSSDDYEQQLSRGILTFYTNFFKLDSVHGVVTKTGTSDYSGQEFTVSATYEGKYMSAGFSVRPPTTITRKFTTSVRVETGGTVSTTAVSGEDKLKFPWRGAVGLSIIPAKDLLLGLEYEIRSYASAVHTQADGAQSSPWLSASVFHVGLQYGAFEWLTLRGGIRGQAEVFEPEGNFIGGEPVSYSIYSGGVGLTYAGIRLDVTYEYGLMKYQDVWGSAVSLNTERRHFIVANVSYDIRWDR
jgi:hypothetical protein